MNSNPKLIQEKLDVKNKSRANIFNWRGQFTPQFVDYLLDSFAKPGDIVIEPFSGSGTVLLECSRKNLSCYGYEINPAAYAMSKFFTLVNLPGEERGVILSAFEEKLLKLLPYFQDLPLFVESNQFRQSFKEDIIIFEKDNLLSQNSCARSVALKHLEIALRRANSDVKKDIAEAIEHLDTIQPSPMFNSNGFIDYHHQLECQRAAK